MNQVKSLKQLSYGGLAAAVLLIIVPQEAFAMHIMEVFYRRCGRWRGGCCFYPACGTGWFACAVSCRKIITRRCCWRCAGRLFLSSRR